MQLNFIHHAARWLLAIFLLFAGIGHLTWARTEFQAQVPGWLPLEADLVVVVSGFVEIGLGLALLVLKSYRQQVGWIAAIFFLLIFPGNISQYINKVDAFGLNSDTTRLIRLFFQPVLILWALWCTGAITGRKKQLAD
jgi:uncharacterized membrane protein